MSAARGEWSTSSQGGLASPYLTGEFLLDVVISAIPIAYRRASARCGVHQTYQELFDSTIYDRRTPAKCGDKEVNPHTLG